jgi:hypothetical protein
MLVAQDASGLGRHALARGRIDQGILGESLEKSGIPGGSRHGTGFAGTRALIMISRFSALLSLFKFRQRSVPPRRFRRVRMFNLLVLVAVLPVAGMSGERGFGDSPAQTFIGGLL